MGEQQKAFVYFKTRAAFQFDAAHLHSSLYRYIPFQLYLERNHARFLMFFNHV